MNATFDDDIGLSLPEPVFRVRRDATVSQPNYQLYFVIDEFLRSKSTAVNTKTTNWYSAMLRHWAQWIIAKKANWLSPEALETYLLQLRAAQKSEATIDGFWKSAKVFLGWVKKRYPELLAGRELPTDIVQRPPDRTGNKLPKAADYDVICAMIDTIEPVTWIDQRDRTLIQLMLSTGLRVSEVAAMRLANVDLRDGFVEVIGGKGNKDRFVPFDQDFKAAFIAWVYSRPSGLGDGLFLEAGKDGQPIGQVTTNAIRKMLARRSEAIGAKTVNPHSIRHLFAIRCLNSGMQLSAVSAMLGHTNLGFTAKVYARWVKTGLRREYDASWQVRRQTQPELTFGGTR